MTVWPRVMVTGHRPQHLPPGSADWVHAELERLAIKLRDEHGMTIGISGMALGADTWWADALVRHGVPLEAHVPFPQQPDRWPVDTQAEWRRLRGLAAKVETYGPEYDVKWLHVRNDGMLRSPADLVIAVLDPAKTDGGTASAVRKATGLRLSIIHVNPRTLATTIRRATPTAA